MCQLCIDAVKQYWPDLPEEDWSTLLMGTTAYPFVSGEETARQLKEMAEASGCDLGTAMAIVNEEMRQAMEGAAPCA